MKQETARKDYIEVNEMFEQDLGGTKNNLSDYNKVLIFSKNRRFSFRFHYTLGGFRIAIDDNYRNHLSRILWESEPLPGPTRRSTKRWLEVGLTSAGVLRFRAYVIYDEGDTPIINELTFGTGGHRLYMQDDGNLVLYNDDKTAVLWASNSWERAKNIPFHIFRNNNGNGHCYDGTLFPNSIEVDFDHKDFIEGISSIKLERYRANYFQWILIIKGEARSREEKTILRFEDDTNSSGGTYTKTIKNSDTYRLRYRSKHPNIKKISFVFKKR